MATQAVKRKLTTILAADVEGYSRLMHEDEEATLGTLGEYREIIDALIARHEGRVFSTGGDSVMAEFGSAVEAVRCAISCQEEIASRNTALADDRKLMFRMGINIGDVMVRDEDLFGDGVNVAARLEGLAEPGGICVSSSVFEQVKHKLSLGFEDLGPQEVKNIAEPVSAYRLVPGSVSVAATAKTPSAARRWRMPAIAAAILMALAAGGVAWWQPWVARVEPASVERMAFPLPEKPSIAVLPFDNLSGNPEQDYLGDGIAENIITTLSQIPDLFVIARNSTFTYKGKPVKVQQVAEDLGVQYVLEGSVQKSGEQLRVTAQLIDAVAGHHLWSQRYDRRLEDLFAVLDDVTREVVLALQVKLTGVRARGTENLEAWASITKGHALFFRFTKEDNARARVLFEDAVRLDPSYSTAWSLLAWTHWADARNDWSESRAESLSKAVELGEKAMTLDERLATNHSLFGAIQVLKREYEQAIAFMEKAVALDPNDAGGKALLAGTLTFAGRPAEAAALLEKAMRLNPYYPAWWLVVLGRAYRLEGRYDEAIVALERTKERMPGNLLAPTQLVTAYSETGRQADAEAEVAYILEIKPDATVQGLGKTLLYKDPKERERFLAALRKAGLPENPPLPLPDKPSIAVLPFTNMSGDPEQEYFADGIAEDIITGLSRNRGVFVIARNSTFTYKGAAVDVKRVSQELGVRYVLEGSVRKAGSRVRITAQLVDATTGNHVWAERYDHQLEDIFAVQDEITRNIVAAIGPELVSAEMQRARRKDPNSLDAWNYTMRARWHRARLTREDMEEARRLALRAIELDPSAAPGFSVLAFTHMMDVLYGWSESPRQSISQAYEAARKAVALDDRDATAHRALGAANMFRRRFEDAVSRLETAIDLDPNNAAAHGSLGGALGLVGRMDEAAERLDTAMRLSPRDPYRYWWLLWRGGADFHEERYDKAAEWTRKALRIKPDFPSGHRLLAAIYGRMGRIDAARAALDRYLRLVPGQTVETLRKQLPIKRPEDMERLLDGLRKAGLPE